MRRPPEAKCFGFALPLSGRPLFLVLTVSAIGSAVLFAALQEGVFQVPGFKFSGWMTFVTAATMAVCGHLELLVTGSRQRVGTLDQYLRLSLLTLAGMYLTNASLKYLNYSTRVLFKSSKLLPTMLLGTLMQGRRYSFLEYLAAGGLVGGITLFTLGDADTLPSFHLAGVGLILLGIAADAATSNFEEKAFFRAVTPASHVEVVAYSSMFGSAWGLLLLLPTGELGAALRHGAKQPQVLPLLVGSSICGYASVSVVLLLIKLYGATVTELVKSMRKVLTVALSFVLYPKPFSWKYAVGGAAVLISLAATQELQRRKGGDVSPAEGGEAQPFARDTSEEDSRADRSSDVGSVDDDPHDK